MTPSPRNAAGKFPCTTLEPQAPEGVAASPVLRGKGKSTPPVSRGINHIPGSLFPVGP